MGFKWRCHECNHLFEENKMSNIIEDKIMKESIRKHRMLRRSARTRTGNSLETGTSKTPDPSITIQVNDSDKSQSHKSRPETIDLSDEEMDIDASNEPLPMNSNDSTIESRIGLDKASADSLKPGKMVLDTVLEYGVGKFVKEIGIDENKIGIVGPAVSDLILQGRDNDHPEIHLKTCRNMLEGTMKNQDNTIFFINYNKNIRTETETLREGGNHWSILLYNKKVNKFFHHDPIANTNKDYAVLMAQKLKNRQYNQFNSD